MNNIIRRASDLDKGSSLTFCVLLNPQFPLSCHLWLGFAAHRQMRLLLTTNIWMYFIANLTLTCAVMLCVWCVRRILSWTSFRAPSVRSLTFSLRTRWRSDDGAQAHAHTWLLVQGRRRNSSNSQSQKREDKRSMGEGDGDGSNSKMVTFWLAVMGKSLSASGNQSKMR
jgi:hypothetical protein